MEATCLLGQSVSHPLPGQADVSLGISFRAPPTPCPDEHVSKRHFKCGHWSGSKAFFLKSRPISHCSPPPAALPPKARLHFLKFWVQGGNQTILTHGMFQVGLAKLLAKTVEVKGIVSAWLCCAQKPTRIVRSL